jgi:hypothetical protein
VQRQGVVSLYLARPSAQRDQHLKIDALERTEPCLISRAHRLSGAHKRLPLRALIGALHPAVLVEAWLACGFVFSSSSRYHVHNARSRCNLLAGRSVAMKAAPSICRVAASPLLVRPRDLFGSIASALGPGSVPPPAGDGLARSLSPLGELAGQDFQMIRQRQPTGFLFFVVSESSPSPIPLRQFHKISGFPRPVSCP